MLRGLALHSSNRLGIDVFFEVPTLQTETPFISRSKVLPLSHFGRASVTLAGRSLAPQGESALRGVAAMTSDGSKIHGPSKSTSMSAQPRVTPELNISGSHVLVVLGAGIGLAGPLVWVFLKYWLFAP
jgi:hypothetical protein